MLDYAANGSRYWPAQLLRQFFEDTCRPDGASPEEIYQGALGGRDPDAFWENVRDDLLAGRLRLLFVADQMIAPGYQHLDVMTAAPVQNNGRPEPISTALAAFTLR